jgi:hypothetical protein
VIPWHLFTFGNFFHFFVESFNSYAMKYQQEKMPKNKKIRVKRNRARGKIEHRFSLQRLDYIY